MQSLKRLLGFPKRIFKGFATPAAFSVRSGHFRSCAGGRAVDRRGGPIPMYTYPAIDFLLARSGSFGDCRILEWGSGQSTLWWERRAKAVVCIEANEWWGEYVLSSVLHKEKVRLVYCPTKAEYERLAETLGPEKFDLIVVDALAYRGGSRYESAVASLRHLDNEGAVLVDNADLGSVAPAVRVLHESGFSRFDFFGLSPGAFHPQCTSLFVKSLSAKILRCSPAIEHPDFPTN